MGGRGGTAAAKDARNDSDASSPACIRLVGTTTQAPRWSLGALSDHNAHLAHSAPGMFVDILVRRGPLPDPPRPPPALLMPLCRLTGYTPGAVPPVEDT